MNSYLYLTDNSSLVRISPASRITHPELRKFTTSQFRSKLYVVPMSECYTVARQFWLSLRRALLVAFTKPPHLTLMMMLTLLFYHQDTPLSLHLLLWLLSLPPINNPRFRNLRMMLSLFGNFLQYLQPLFHHPALQPLLLFLQVLYPSRLLSFLPGRLAANNAPPFGKIRTGT